MNNKPDSSVKLFSYTDDLPTNGKGLLIPGGEAKSHPEIDVFSDQATSGGGYRSTRIVATFVSFAAVMFLGASGFQVMNNSQTAAPIVTVVGADTDETVVVDYGASQQLKNLSVLEETREAFIDESATFIEIDLSQNQLRFFVEGVLLKSMEIDRYGEDNSWWDIPAGLYQVEKTETESFSTIGQVNFPHAITFQGNYMIHGVPEYQTGESVDEEFNGGGVWLSNEDALELFEVAEVGQPVLVQAAGRELTSSFVFEPKVLGVSTKSYLVKDIETGAILASQNYQQPLPIASVTKLMTAVVATEEIDLDSRVRLGEEELIQSLVPRLSGRSSVSVYTLLKLLLVESSNEAADVIAHEVGLSDFIDAMNNKAKDIGMDNTNFDDPSGLSSDNTSTAEDMFTLIKYMYNDKSFLLDITADVELSNVYLDEEFSELINFNEVENIDNFIAGKVGETEAAGLTSLTLHEVTIQGEDRVVVVVLLGTDDRNRDIGTLLSDIESRY